MLPHTAAPQQLPDVSNRLLNATMISYLRSGQVKLFPTEINSLLPDFQKALSFFRSFSALLGTVLEAGWPWLSDGFSPFWRWFCCLVAPRSGGRRQCWAHPHFRAQRQKKRQSPLVLMPGLANRSCGEVSVGFAVSPRCGSVL